MTFWRKYLNFLKRLPRNLGFWFFVVLILGVGPSYAGKLIGVISLILIMPIYEIMFGFEEDNSDKGEISNHLELWEKLGKMPGGDKDPFDTPLGPTQECLSANKVVSFTNEGEKDLKIVKHLKGCKDCRERISRFKQNRTF